MTTWPLQKDCDRFYGNPRDPKDRSRPSAAWEAANLVSIKPPYRMTYDGKPIRGIRVHKKCAESLLRVLTAIWEASGRQQSVVDAWGASIYAGAYNFRLMRGGSSLSMHSWGCAIDLDPARNGMGDTTPNFAKHSAVLKAFADEGWEWGGDWSGKSCDGMHWQAAWTRAKPARIGTPVPAQPAPPTKPVTPAKPAPPLPLAGTVIVKPVVGDPGFLSDKPTITLVQSLLKDKGWTPGSADGILGPATGAAIVSFRMAHTPELKPFTPQIDETFLAALKAFEGGKPVSGERAAITQEDLKKAEEPTILSAEQVRNATIGAGAFAGVGAVDQQGKIDQAKSAIEDAGVVRDIAEKGLDLVQWFAQKWWIPVLLIVAYILWKNQKVIRQRVTDARTGKNMSV